MDLRLAILLVASTFGAPAATAGQNPPTPQPFPRPGEQQPPPSPAPPAAAPPSTTQPAPPRPGTPASADTPTEATLGVPIYPGAQFLGAFDAGRGQHYYLFGTNSGVEEMVSYYRTVLRTRGDRIFEQPATHMFEVGRFREETMAFPPSITIKDYAWNGSEGYMNPRPGQEPARFRTVIQIVPPPSTAAPGS